MRWWGWIPIWIIAWFVCVIIFNVTFSAYGWTNHTYWAMVLAALSVLFGSALVHGMKDKSK